METNSGLKVKLISRQRGFNFENLGSELAEARITQEDFIKALSGANQGFMAFGGDLETGAQKFLDTVQIANTDFRDANRALGLSASETADFIARFIEDQKLGLLQNNISERELAATSFRLNRNLAVLAELTGKDVDQLREEMLTNQMAAGAQIALAKAERDGAKGLVVAFESVRAGLPEVLKPFVDQSVKFDAAIGDLAPLNVFGNVIQDLNRDLDNLRLTSMSQEERELEAVRIVETFIQDMADDKLDTGDKEKLAEAEFENGIPNGKYIEWYKNEKVAKTFNTKDSNEVGSIFLKLSIKSPISCELSLLIPLSMRS